MDEQKIIFSNRFEKEKFEDYKTDLGTGNTITPDFMEADDFLKFIQKNRRSVPSKERIADKDKKLLAILFILADDISFLDGSKENADMLFSFTYHTHHIFLNNRETTDFS